MVVAAINDKSHTLIEKILLGIPHVDVHKKMTIGMEHSVTKKLILFY